MTLRALWSSRLGSCFIVAFAYAIGAKLGFSFAFETQQVTAVWPPSGIALAAFLLRGPGIWPGVFAGAVFCNILIDVPTGAAVAIAAGNTIGPYAGARLLRRHIDFNVAMSRLRDVLALAVISLAAMTVTATNGAIVLFSAGLITTTQIAPVWALWWIGDAMGAILVAPLILSWSVPAARKVNPGAFLELLFCLLITACVSYLCFTSIFPLAYPVFPVVAWIAIRFQQRFATLAVAITSSIAVWQKARGHGPFVFETPDYHLGMLVCFMAVLSLTALALAAMAAERAAAEDALRLSNQDLETKVAARTDELARTYADLRLSEERFRGAFETSVHGMAIVSTDGRWLRVNQALCDIVGYSENELLITDFQSITHEEDLELDISHVKQLLDGQANSYQMEKRYYHKQGQIVWILLSVAIVRTINNEPLHFVSQIVDITKQTIHTAALTEAKVQADAASRAKNIFLANMSHELRTPMTGIIGFADLLVESGLTASQLHYVSLMRNASHSLLAIIDDILDLTKVEAGRIEFANAPYSPSEILHETVELFRASAEGRGLIFSYSVDARLPALVEGDPKRLRQCLANLVSNASKYTQEGRIDIRARRSDSDATLRFSVTDTGMGIDRGELHLLFQNFSRLENGRIHGTGLGLAITKRLVEGMGGEVGVESAYGRGSTFWFDLPLRSPSVLELSAPNAFDYGPSKAVLVVEDIEINQIIIRAILESAKHRVTVVASGHDALAALADHDFDLVLMDVQMPGIDGFETTQRIRACGQQYADLPILALSANAMADEIFACKLAGMDDHVAKPIDRHVLLTKIASYASRPAQSREMLAPVM